MALHVGDYFKQRWLEAPHAVRQVYIDELHMVSQLLADDTDVKHWQQQYAIAQQRNQHVIANAYETRKQQILAEQAYRAEQRKRARQAELEQRLEMQRAEQRDIEAAFWHDEYLQQQRQTEYLQQYADVLKQQPVPHAERFDTRLGEIVLHEDLKTRLEMEAEYYIEQTLQQLRLQLQAAAKEEIEMIIVQAKQ